MPILIDPIPVKDDLNRCRFTFDRSRNDLIISVSNQAGMQARERVCMYMGARATTPKLQFEADTIMEHGLFRLNVDPHGRSRPDLASDHSQHLLKCRHPAAVFYP